MKRLALSIVLISLLGSASGAPARASEEPSDQASDSIVMGPPLQQSIAGWHELSRAPARFEDGSYIWPNGLAAVADRLVLVGQHCPPEEGRCKSAVWHSDDGVTWTRSEIPGTDPKINDLAETAEGAVAIGTDGPARESSATMWSTQDGIEWTTSAAPPAHKAGRIVATGDKLVVQADQTLWASRNGTTWKRLGKSPSGMPAVGPGGFLSWEGGGQDLFTPTKLWHSPDADKWTEVRLPKPLRGGHPAFGEIQVMSIGDLWVLIPKEKAPKSIFTSKDGKRWKQVPRPAGMHGGYVEWMERIGDDVQAAGILYGPRSALWAWDLGKRSVGPELFKGRTEQGFGAPVAWRDAYVALGTDSRCGAEDNLTIWRWEEPDEAVDPAGTPATTGEPAPPECWGWGKDMHGMRYSHTSTLLGDGRVLVVGGAGGSGTSDLETTEVFDAGVESFGLTGYLVEGRDLTTATRLADGRVLVAGGTSVDGPIESAELYDPSTGLFSLTGSRTRAGAPDDAILLDDGRVLLVDGRHAETYDPESETFTAISPMTNVRGKSQLARLPDGRVLIVGRGTGKDSRAAAEVFDPVSATFEPQAVDRALAGGHTLTTLQDGRVLLAGGDGDPASAHLYDPATGSFESAGSLDRARSGHSAVLLSDGRVLLISGLGERGTPRSVEAYDPVTGEFGEAGQTKRPRISAEATLLEDGRVLISGGRHEFVNVEGTAELYDPATAKSDFIKPALS